jgi:hypothetical protein
MDELRMINYSKRLEKTQNALKFMIPEHFLNWKRITMVNKSKTPFFLSPPANDTRWVFGKLAMQHPQLVYSLFLSLFD